MNIYHNYQKSFFFRFWKTLFFYFRWFNNQYLNLIPLFFSISFLIFDSYVSLFNCKFLFLFVFLIFYYYYLYHYFPLIDEKLMFWKPKLLLLFIFSESFLSKFKLIIFLSLSLLIFLLYKNGFISFSFFLMWKFKEILSCLYGDSFLIGSSGISIFSKSNFSLFLILLLFLYLILLSLFFLSFSF